MAVKTCRKCFKTVVKCPLCKGRGRIWGFFGACTQCDGTGYQCPDHGKYWHR